MPVQTDSLNRRLYDLLNSRGYNPIPRDSDVQKAGKTVAPEEADVFKFTFKQGDKEIDDAWVTVDGSQNLTLYYDHDLSKQADTRTAGSPFDDSWYGLLRHLKKWAHNRQLGFKLEPKEKIDSDMAQRTYMKKKEQVTEGYHPMGKSASYNDNVPSVKIILQHTRQIQEGEQRYRNIAKIFLENTEGERILAPTKKPGIAQVYARHLAEGGVPNDERWNHIKSMCEEYTKMAGFVRAVRGNQFNESAQKLVEAGLNHYVSIRETLGRLRGHRGYNTYFESWTPTLMETENDETTINELFVQETLDPRIESVMPILNKLSKNLNEMSEVKSLEEWADNVITMEEQGVAEGAGEPDIRPGMKTNHGTVVKVNGNTVTVKASNGELTNVNIHDIQQGVAEGGNKDRQWSKKDMEELRVAIRDFDDIMASAGPEAFKQELTKKRIQTKPMAGPKGVLPEQGVTEAERQPGSFSGAWQILVNGKKVHSFRGNFDQETADRVGVVKAASRGLYNPGSGDKIKIVPVTLDQKQGVAEGLSNDGKKWFDLFSDQYQAYSHQDQDTDPDTEEALRAITWRGENPIDVARQILDYVKSNPDEVGDPEYDLLGNAVERLKNFVAQSQTGMAEGSEEVEESGLQAYLGNKKYGKEGMNALRKAGQEGASKEKMANIRAKYDKLDEEDIEEGVVDTLKKVGKKVLDVVAPDDEKLLKQLQQRAGIPAHAQHGKPRMAVPNDEKEVSEDLDADQKRAGQLGPTEKVKNNNIGKLVGANESVELSEMDKSQPSSDRGGESSGDPHAKGGKATPVKTKDMNKDAEKELNKGMAKAHKKDVKEGQEDLDAILRIIRK